MRLVLLLLLLFSCALTAQAVPDWVLKGILYVETRSSYTTIPGTPITYVDQRTGKAGELGPFQMTRIAFDQVARPGESFTRLGRDTRYAEDFALRYLRWLYANAADGNWNTAVAMYNTGPTGYRRNLSIARQYLRKVQLVDG